MAPLTILAAQKLLNLLTNDNAIEHQTGLLAAAADISIPELNAAQVVLSSANADIADRNMQLSYPRISLYSSGLKNTQIEKFRSFSGTVSIVAEIWVSANLVQQTDQWIHFYTEAVTTILRVNIGDWGDGFFFSGIYDVQFQPPKVGGFGYVQSAKITCNLNASLN